VYFGAYDGVVYSLDAKTGAPVWKYDDADWVGSSPALAPDIGLLFIGLEFGLFRKRGGIVALRIETGEEVWRARTPELTHGSPLYIAKENLVVIGSNDGIIYAYDAKNGTEHWKFGGGEVKSSFAYDAKRRLILFGSLNGHFYALNAQSGTPVFARETGAGIYSTPCLDDDVVYAASLDKKLYAIDLDTWKDKWVFETNGRIFASPIVIEESVWIGSNDGRLYEISRESGKAKGYFQTTERIVNRIAYNPATKLFFVPTHANEIYCLRRTSLI
jgi:outer membrane protein assembly factor BamB